MSKRSTLIRNTPEEEAAINVGIARDPDAPEMASDAFKSARRGRPRLPEGERKIRVEMRADPDVVAEAKRRAERTGRGYTAEMNAALRKAFSLDAEPGD